MINGVRAKLASGWDYFGIGIFYFGLDRKIPKIPEIGIGILKPLKNPEKSRVQNSEHPGIGIGI